MASAEMNDCVHPICMQSVIRLLFFRASEVADFATDRRVADARGNADSRMRGSELRGSQGPNRKISRTLACGCSFWSWGCAQLISDVCGVVQGVSVRVRAYADLVQCSELAPVTLACYSQKSRLVGARFEAFGVAYVIQLSRAGSEVTVRRTGTCARFCRVQLIVHV